MTIPTRTLVISICLALLGTLAGLIPQAQANASGNPDGVDVTVTVDVPVVTPVVRSRPAEDDPGFNSCTMGVDGRFPASDARHYVPGPCDLGTVLPYGARFTVDMYPTAVVGRCTTRASVVDAAGRSVEFAFAWWTLPCGEYRDITPLLRRAAEQLNPR